MSSSSPPPRPVPLSVRIHPLFPHLPPGCLHLPLRQLLPKTPLKTVPFHFQCHCPPLWVVLSCFWWHWCYINQESFHAMFFLSPIHVIFLCLCFYFLLFQHHFLFKKYIMIKVFGMIMVLCFPSMCNGSVASCKKTLSSFFLSTTEKKTIIV